MSHLTSAPAEVQPFALAYAPPADPIASVPFRLRPIARFLAKPTWTPKEVRRMDAFGCRIDEDFGQLDDDTAHPILLALEEAVKAWNKLCARPWVRVLPFDPSGPAIHSELAPITKPKASKPVKVAKPAKVAGPTGASFVVEVIESAQRIASEKSLSRAIEYATTRFGNLSAGLKGSVSRHIGGIDPQYVHGFPGEPTRRFGDFVRQCIVGSPVSFPEPTPKPAVVATEDIEAIRQNARFDVLALGLSLALNDDPSEAIGWFRALTPMDRAAFAELSLFFRCGEGSYPEGLWVAFLELCRNGSPVTFPERTHTVATPIQAPEPTPDRIARILARQSAIKANLARREEANTFEYKGQTSTLGPDEADRIARRRSALDGRRHALGLRRDEIAKGMRPGEYGAQLPTFASTPAPDFSEPTPPADFSDLMPISGGSPEAILDPFATVLDIPTVQDDHEADEWILEDAYEAIIVAGSRRSRLAHVEDAIRTIVSHILETEVRIALAARVAWQHRMSPERREDFQEWVESCGIRIDPFGDAPTDPAEMFEWMCVEARDGCLIEFPETTPSPEGDDDDSDAPASTVLVPVPSGVLPGHAGEDHGSPVARDDRAGAGDVSPARLPLGRGPVSRLQATEAAAGVVEAPETLTILGRVYGLSAAPGGWDICRADGICYRVTMGPLGLECDCPSFRFACQGIHGAQCKHCVSVREAGLMPIPNPEGDDDGSDDCSRRAMPVLLQAVSGEVLGVESRCDDSRTPRHAGSHDPLPGIVRAGHNLLSADHPRPRAYWTLDPSRPGPVRLTLDGPLPHFSDTATEDTMETLESLGIMPVSGGSPEATPAISTTEARHEMLKAIARAQASGIDGHTLDRMRLACEFFTNPAFKEALQDHVWENRK